MKRLIVLISILLVFLVLSACSVPQSAVTLPPASVEENPAPTATTAPTITAVPTQTPQPTQTPDLDATAAAEVSAATAAEESMQATIETVVAATQSVQQTQAVEQFSVEEMSEEEISDAVVEDAAQTAGAVDEIASITEDAVSDGELTAEEIAELEALYLETYEEIEYLLYLTSIYSYYYGDLAEETLELMVALEDDLWILIDLAEEYSDELMNVLAAVESGGEITEEMIYALEDTADEWLAQMDVWQGNAGDWQSALQTEWQERAAAWLETVPEDAAQTRVAALAQAREYAAQVREAFADGVLSAEEMSEISQLAANAINSLENVGGEQLQSFAETITNLTTMMAVGELPSMLQDLGAFEDALPNR